MANTVDPLSPNNALISQAEPLRARLPDQRIGTSPGHCSVIPQGEFSLAESAEEVSLHMAHKIEDKLHAERKVRGETPVAEITIDSILAHIAQTHEEDAQAKLEQFAARILSGELDPREALNHFSENVVRQYLALQYALHKGRRNRAPEDLLAELVDVLSELEQKHGAAIRAGLNTIDAATAYAHDAIDVAKFQSAYQDVVLGEATLSKTLTMALSRFGGRRIAEGLKNLILALGMDLSAASPSVSPERIHALIKDMYLLEVAVTILDGCRDLADRLTTAARDSFDNERLMQEVVGISGDKWISEARFVSLADSHGIAALTDRIAFLAGVRTVLKDLPTQIYLDHEARAAVLDAAQNALDDAIDQELP